MWDLGVCLPKVQAQVPGVGFGGFAYLKSKDKFRVWDLGVLRGAWMGAGGGRSPMVEAASGGSGGSQGEAPPLHGLGERGGG